MYSAIIIGFGKAGRRFYNVLKHMNKDRVLVNILCVVEQDENKIQDLDVECFSSCEKAFEKYKSIDLVFICSNEKDHYSNFKEIKNNKLAYKRIITEKPLTKNLSEAEWIYQNFNIHDITLNFVERYSPICSIYKDWVVKNQLEAYRVIFFWGKNRIYDSRPTIGTFSEISHPIDLVSYLCDGRNPTNRSYTITESITSQSEFNPYQGNTMDSISVNYLMGDIHVTGHSSFIWDERNRKILIYLKDKKNNIFLCKLVFDNPNWDSDILSIYKIDKEGKKMEYEYSVKREDLDEEIYGLNKIYKFINENINSLSQKNISENLAYCDQAIFIQKILEDLKPLVNTENHEKDVVF
ncbi:Gfo/Idh/MocA family oxidoreductase [Lysinibacillus sp. NPDC093190]|uniref:Gfo/Idh/MocA family oxidoreductase n=1 Tax=Lysinibacillus sp. NPDC093190 TaxID=3390575 RepID=UPI003D08EDDF